MPGFLTYGSYRLLETLLGPLPPRSGYGVARAVGRLFYAFSPKLKQTLSHNIRHVLGPDATEDEVQALVRQACVNVAKGHYDLFRLNHLTKDEILGMIEIEGYERLERALAEGRGVVVISAHFGNVDIVAQVPLMYGVPVTAAVEHIEPERLFQYLLDKRQSHGLHLLPTDGPMMGLYRALKRGEMIALPGDWVVAENTRPVEFFGKSTKLPDGAVQVARRTGAAIVPVFALRLPDDTFRVQVDPPLDLPRTDDREADVAQGMKMVVGAMERHISRHPEQWLVAQPVWPLE